MQEKEVFKNEDLVLKVNQNIDPDIFDLNKYEPFLEILCVGRKYQREAIRETVRFLLGKNYSNLKELAEENWHNNEKLQEKYSDEKDFYKNLEIPNKLSCSLDLATGTGKSYVLYGIAQIMLCEGAIDRVLLLCPSLTIKDGLTEKFKDLAVSKILKDSLPKNSVYKNPRITNADETVEKGGICIKNIHAVYQRSSSSIQDSFKNKGEKTLCLSDEVHHIYSPANKDLKKWEEFLVSDDYNFKYLVGCSGTCYIGNEYFTNVIYRYSLRKAIEEKQVKDVQYIYENQDQKLTEDTKFQEIYQVHKNNSVKYNKIKPLTILITKDISTCKTLISKFQKFLKNEENLSIEQAEAKTLIVTSSLEHEKNRDILKKVDNKNNKVEYIFSVAMLTEGWDVKNVFQIVPHEKKAFNSKLLIAQVLGRGLRIPLEYADQQPSVKIFNHEKFYSEIKSLVDEILEREKRIYSYVVNKDKDYNFEIYNIDYNKSAKLISYQKEGSYNFDKKFIAYSPQPKVKHGDIVFVSAKNPLDKTIIKVKKRIYFKSVDEVVNEVKNKISLWSEADDKDYLKMYPEKKIEEMVSNSLKKIKEKRNLVSDENYQKTLQAFGVIRRSSSKFKTIRYEASAKNLKKISTAKDLGKSSIALSTLYKDGSIIYDDNTLKLSEKNEVKMLENLNKEFEEGSRKLNTASLKLVENSYNLKTPLNLVTVSHRPERLFVGYLIKEENAKCIDSWVKSRDNGFYIIDFSWRKGEHPKNGNFNPDFFIKIKNKILIIEIKADNDLKDENKGKIKSSKKHINKLNSLQNKQDYYFWMISPDDYDNFFEKLRTENLKNFVSTLELNLE